MDSDWNPTDKKKTPETWTIVVKSDNDEYVKTYISETWDTHTPSQAVLNLARDFLDGTS